MKSKIIFWLSLILASPLVLAGIIYSFAHGWFIAGYLLGEKIQEVILDKVGYHEKDI